MLIGVTSFFRDEEVFKALEERIFPRLAEEAQASGVLRMWVPGCATGEGAYSLAMLALEAAQRDGSFTVVVFATDIDEGALAFARAGRYGRETGARIRRDRLARFFEESQGELVVKKDLRDACVFSAHDVVHDPPLCRMDLVACRNVLIYFDAESKRRAIGQLHVAVRPRGVLVLGRAEGIAQQERLFEAIDGKLRIYSPRAAGRPLAISHVPRFELGSTPGFGLGPRAKKEAEVPMTADFERILLREIAPACVIVDAKGMVLHFSGPVGRYVEPRGPPYRRARPRARALRGPERAATRRGGAHHGGGRLRSRSYRRS
jgi:two-component system CheB/CheR fusion protein